MIATVKIIPFAVEPDLIKKFKLININKNPVIEVVAITPHKVGVIITKFPTTKEKIIKKSSQKINKRVNSHNSEVHKEIICNHNINEISNSIQNLIKIKDRLNGWQLESFEESYQYKVKNGISLFKKNLLNE